MRCCYVNASIRFTDGGGPLDLGAWGWESQLIKIKRQEGLMGNLMELPTFLFLGFTGNGGALRGGLFPKY